MVQPPKLYGMPLSPAFRSVAWALLQKGVAFDVQWIVPGATNKRGSRHPDFLAKTFSRTHKIPIYEEKGGQCLTISEAPATLIYLCEQNGWNEWYPPFSPSTATTKTRIDSYLHWHHSVTRALSLLSRPILRPDLNHTKQPQSSSSSSLAPEKKAAESALLRLETGWLQGSLNVGGYFIAGTDQPTIADLLAYEEVIQATILGKVDLVQDDTYKLLQAWTERMQELPYHEAAHAALFSLGAMMASNPTSITMSHLGAATREGLEAIKAAQ